MKDLASATTLMLVLASGMNCSTAQDKPGGLVSQELLDLAAEFEEYVASGGLVADFSPSNSAIRVDSGFVLVDATAAESGQELLAELVLHGLKNGSVYRLIVSGWYPIDSISSAANLQHLTFMRAAQMATGVRVDARLRERSSEMLASYPNPFRVVTHIGVEISTAARIRLAIYDVGGRLMDVIVDGAMPPGFHLLSWHPSRRVSGLYFAHLESRTTTDVEPIVLLK